MSVTSIILSLWKALSPRTLKCRFVAYVRRYEENIDFHVVCRDECVETDDYLPGFIMCGNQAATVPLISGDALDVSVRILEGQKRSEQMVLHPQQCRGKNGQSVQMWLNSPNIKPVMGEVVITSLRTSTTVCIFTFLQDVTASPSTTIASWKRSSGSPPTLAMSQYEVVMPEKANWQQKGDYDSKLRKGTTTASQKRASGRFVPVRVITLDEMDRPGWQQKDDGDSISKGGDKDTKPTTERPIYYGHGRRLMIATLVALFVGAFWAVTIFMQDLYMLTDQDTSIPVPVAPFTIRSYVVGTEGRVIQEYGGVKLIFPQGCVSEERVISVEVDVMPIDDLVNQKFQALSAVITVKQSQTTPFLKSVTVTLPWMWRKYTFLPEVNTTLMHFQPNRGWSAYSAELYESDHTVTFQTFHFQSYFVVKTLHDAVYFVEKIWNGYAEDKVHLSIIPNVTTREITMLCTHKLQDQQDFFFISEEQLRHQFKQQVHMKSNEKIEAMFTDKSDIEIEEDDIPQNGITFYFPPATANRYSLRLKAKDGADMKQEYEGSIHFDRIQGDGRKSVSTMEEAINNALIYLRPRTHAAMANTEQNIISQGSDPSATDSNDVMQYFHKTVKGVGTSWKELALELGLSYETVQVIDQNVRLKDDFEKCWETLHQWRQINGKKATLNVLKEALTQIGMSSVKDEL
ncbi:uncharacterized protein LOC144886084 isoform X2 [Branchiostoma floridae x Branchiostoma japonicum]